MSVCEILYVGIWSNSIKILFSLLFVYCEFLPFFTWWTEILFEDIYQTFILFKDGIVVIMHMNITLYMIIQLCWFATDKVDPGEKPPMESNLWHECTPITACCASNGNILTEHSFLIKQNWAWNLIFSASLEKKLYRFVSLNGHLWTYSVINLIGENLNELFCLKSI